MSEQSALDESRIKAMDPEKRQRILNAAMKEFRKGYKAASTDAMVREAGISKGLLFHYFGTKRGLYQFVMACALELVIREFFDLINVTQPDLLERLWQMSLLKRDLCVQYPDIFEFLTMSYLERQDESREELDRQYVEAQKTVFSALYENVDRTPFREGVDPAMAADIIRWTLNGFSDQLLRGEQGKSFAEMMDSYDGYLRDLRKYLDCLRHALYREEYQEAKSAGKAKEIRTEEV